MHTETVTFQFEVFASAQIIHSPLLIVLFIRIKKDNLFFFQLIMLDFGQDVFSKSFFHGLASSSWYLIAFFQFSPQFDAFDLRMSIIHNDPLYNINFFTSRVKIF